MCDKNFYKRHDIENNISKFSHNFLNSDFSFDNESNVTKWIGHVLCIPLEGSVSQNLIYVM